MMIKHQVPFLFGLLAIVAIAQPVFAEDAAKPAASVQQATKQRLVLMPLRMGEADRNLHDAMETAVVQGLQTKYEVFSGERVATKAREIFNKESTSEHKKECDETRCMQDIAESFQSELIAVANVTKQTDGYFLAITIQNIFDNKVVFSDSLPCRGCDAYQVVDKLKLLASGNATQFLTPAAKEVKVELPPDTSPRHYQIILGIPVESYSSPDKTATIKAAYLSGSLGLAYMTDSGKNIQLSYKKNKITTWNARALGYNKDHDFTRKETAVKYSQPLREGSPYSWSLGYTGIDSSLSLGQDATKIAEYTVGGAYRYGSLFNYVDLFADVGLDKAHYTGVTGTKFSSSSGTGYSLGAIYRHFGSQRHIGMELGLTYRNRTIQYPAFVNGSSASFNGNESTTTLSLAFIGMF